jgi:hypothetical protein
MGGECGRGRLVHASQSNCAANTPPERYQNDSEMLVSELTFTVIAEAHLCLAEADRVFARADAIELLELALLDILARRRTC